MSNAHKPDPEPEIYNLQRALTRLRGNQDLLREMVAFYLEDYPALLERIARAAEAGDPIKLARNAHSLKGLASTFDGNRVVEATSSLREAAQANPSELPHAEIAKLKEAAEELAECLQRSLDDSGESDSDA